MNSIQLNDVINQIKIRLHNHISPQRRLSLELVPTSPDSILIRFSDIYQKDYRIDLQTPDEIVSDFNRNLFDALCKQHKAEEERFSDVINYLTARLNQNTPPDNWKYLIIIPVGIESIQIQFADIYKKVYQIVNQTPEEIACDFERNLFEELYKLYRKGVIPNDSNH